MISNKLVLLFISIIFAFAAPQSDAWPASWKRQPQTISLKAKHEKPLSVLAKTDGIQGTNSLSIAAKTLTDSYYSKLSVVSVRQQASILDLAHHLNNPGFSNLENNLISASARVTGGTAQLREEPPEDEDDKDENGDSSKELSALESGKAKLESEQLLGSITNKVLSLSKVVLKVTKILSGFSFNLIGAMVTGPVKKTIAKVVRERKVSSCSKMSLATVVMENEKLEALINSNKCNFVISLEHSLINLKVSLSIFKCYIMMSADISNAELNKLNDQIVEMIRLMSLIEKTYQKSLTRTGGHEDEFFTTVMQSQILELQNKLTELVANDLIMKQSLIDSFLPTYVINIEQMMRDISNGIFAHTSLAKLQKVSSNDIDLQNSIEQQTIATKDIDQTKMYCQTTLSSGEILSDDLRLLGTTTVDKLIKSAKNIVNSFEGFTSTLSRGIDQINTYKDMYDQLLTVAKSLRPEVSSENK